MGTQPEIADPATLLRSLTRNVPGVIYRCALDTDWTMHLIGEEIERITGYPASDFVHNRVRTYASVIHDDDRARVERDVFDAVDANRPFELEYRVTTARGEQRWVLERGCRADGGEWLDGIIFDITERRRFEETARRAEAEAAVARELTESRRRIVRAGDEARRRIERDLHDGAQQAFVCARLTLRSAQELIAEDPEAAAELLAAAQEHLDTGLSDLRDLAHGIHPAQLAAAGVGAAIGTLQGRAPIPITLVDELTERLPSDVEAALYFSCAEAIANAVKHSGAETIFVRLGRIDGSVFADVVDDGAGGASLDGGSGLRGLSDRVAALSGTVSVDSPPGVGTRLTVRIPHRMHP